MGVNRHNLVFDGIDAAAYGLVVYRADVDEIAARDVEAVEIAGRNGVLHLDNGRWRERTQTYGVYVPTPDSGYYADALGRVRTMFGQRGKGYKRLTDTYNPDSFALASFVDAIAPEPLAFRTKGVIELSFSCRPERFLKSGERVITTASSVTLNNPTGMPARPLLRVYGTGAGTLSVGAVIVYIDAIDGYVDIDCDLCDCYKGAVNCNSDVRLSEFPTLGAGSTGVSITGALASVEITPRWWRL